MNASPKDRGLRSKLAPLDAIVSDSVEPWDPPAAPPAQPLRVAPELEPEPDDELDGEEPLPEPELLPPGKKRKVPKTNSGTRKNPYPRQDGRKMVKMTLSVTEGFDRDLRVFAARLPPGLNKSTWAERVLRRAMARFEARRAPSD